MAGPWHYVCVNGLGCQLRICIDFMTVNDALLRELPESASLCLKGDAALVACWNSVPSTETITQEHLLYMQKTPVRYLLAKGQL